MQMLPLPPHNADTVLKKKTFFFSMKNPNPPGFIGSFGLNRVFLKDQHDAFWDFHESCIIKMSTAR